MATVEDDESTTARWSETDVRFGIDRLTLVVVGVASVALLLRLVALGERTAHWDEGRVGWWILEFMRTNSYEYDAIIHGPFYHHVNRVLFGVFGATDAVMRLAPAVIGGLLPLSALGLRHRLRDSETVLVAVFLTVTPVLLYYSRFMRGDPIVAFSMFAAFVLFVRAVDFRSKPALFGGIALVAIAFTAKENALIYLVTWLGAAVLLLDHRLFVAGENDENWTAVLGDSLRRVGRGLLQWWPFLVIGLAEFLFIVIWFYAPRAGDPTAVGLNNVAANPGLLPEVLSEATVGSWNEFYTSWVGGGHQDHAYIPYLGDFAETLAYGAPVVCLLAVFGFVVDRYAADGPRDLVSFAAYWGFVSVLGYPIVTDIMAPWATVNAVVPLVIPAAVGGGLLVRWGRAAFAEDDHLGVGIAAALFLVLAAIVAGATMWGVYLAPQAEENAMVQYAQPGDNLQPALDKMEVAAATNNGTDVLLYGDYFVDGDEEAERSPDCAAWFDSLPLPWYFAAHNATVDCAETADELPEAAAEDPPIVITRDSENATVRRQFPDYWTATYELRTYNTETFVMVSPEYANGTQQAAESAS